MAMSFPATPKNNFTTPGRLVNSRTPIPIEKSQYITPRKLCKLNKTPTETPDCFTNVTLETPGSSKCRTSKDKFDEESNLTVAVRIRPMNSRELSTVGVTDMVRVRNQELIIRSQPQGSATAGLDHIFQYDHVFWSCDETNPVYATQEDVFMTIGKPLLKSAFRGYNACLFAYGQTGSGKSFSMMGKNNCEIIDIDSEEHAGVIPRFCRDLFVQIEKLDANSTAAVEVNYFEIYNEKIHDLLADQTKNTRMPLKVREHPVWGPYVVDLSVHSVKSYKELRDWLAIGNKNRATAATNMNEKSSRSHSIFSIELCLSDGLNKGDSCRRSRVSLVDLAGSERLGNSHNSEEKIRQGVSINKSLLTLGKVISALADQKRNQFVPYRDSVLTWLLRESLGGNSLTSMLATITPASTHLDETLATLRYACQARSIVNRARINENPHDRLIRQLRSEVERLRALRKDYERNSIPSSSSLVLLTDTSNSEELDELRGKLVETERKLLDAEKSWEQRFMETKETQLKELAEVERYKMELESKVRVMKTANNKVNLSPYRTDFLKELEGVLTDQNVPVCDSDILESIKTWCLDCGLTCTFTSDALIITDTENKHQCLLLVKNLRQQMTGFENICDFVNSLTWTECRKCDKKLSKSEVMSSMNEIYQALGNLQPSDNENNLSLLFAKVNKSLQSFEAALLNHVAKSNGPKSVTFNM